MICYGNFIVLSICIVPAFLTVQSWRTNQMRKILETNREKKNTHTLQFIEAVLAVLWYEWKFYPCNFLLAVIIKKMVLDLSKQSSAETKFDHEPEYHACKEGFHHGEEATNTYICHVLNLRTRGYRKPIENCKIENCWQLIQSNEGHIFTTTKTKWVRHWTAHICGC